MTEQDKVERKCLNALPSCFLEQLLAEHARGTIFDLIVSNTQELIQEVTLAEPLSYNDHDKIRFNIQSASRAP